MKLIKHEEVKDWAKKSGARPAVVNADGADTSILRFDFDSDADNLHEVNWEHFFELFEQNKLALVVSEDDKKFNKFVSREG